MIPLLDFHTFKTFFLKESSQSSQVLGISGTSDLKRERERTTQHWCKLAKDKETWKKKFIGCGQKSIDVS